MKFLVLDLEAPITSFGGDVVDNRGVVRDFPAKSMLAGMIGNSLGLERSDAGALDALQASIVHAAAKVRPGHRARDYQTARLFENESGWTHQGLPEGRAKSPSFSWDSRYELERGERRKSLTHQRYRDHDADARTLVAFTLDPAPSSTDIDEVENALRRPARPLFIGRKASIPSRPVLGERLEATSACAALATAMRDRGFVSARVQWHPASGPNADEERSTIPSPTSPPYTIVGTRELTIGDERRHASGVHGGTRVVMEGTLSLDGESSDDVLDVHSLTELAEASR